MESQGCSHDITWLPCLGVKEDQEEQHDVKAEIFQAGEGRAEKGAWGQPGMGAVGTDSEREDLNGGREDHFGPAAPGPVGDGNKNGGTSGSGLEQEQKEPVAEGTESQKSVRPRAHPRFTQWLEQLETIFRHSHSHNALAREYLERWMVVNDSRVQDWFKIRRATYRRNRRRATRGIASGP